MVPASIRDASVSSERLTATVTYNPFQARLFQACHHALAQLEVQTRTLSDTFTETGEVLFWLYAISNYGRRRASISRGLRWARNRYAHGQLFTEPHKMSGPEYDTDFVWDRSGYAEPHWKHALEIAFATANAGPDQKGLQAYQDELASRIAALLDPAAPASVERARSARWSRQFRAYASRPTSDEHRGDDVVIERAERGSAVQRHRCDALPHPHTTHRSDP